MALYSASAYAATATSLGSFEGVEEPLVRFTSATGAFTPDSFVNIIDEGAGMFRMSVRYRSDVWDADRDTLNKDRQRAEVKGLGVHQKTGETFEYATTWRTNLEFRGSPRFCHVFQLKSTDGDSGAPLITISVLEATNRAAVRYWPGHDKTATDVREFSWTPGAWQTVRIRVKPSTTHDGEVLVSVDGDAFRGVTGVDVYRPDASDYRPKWGLYRGVTTGMSLGDDYVEHKQVSAKRLEPLSNAGESEPPAATLTNPAESAAVAFARVKAESSSLARTATLATIAGEWASRAPKAAMAMADQLAAGDPARQEAVQHVFNRWADQDPEVVLQWANNRPPSEELDNLLWYFSTDTTLRYVHRDLALKGAELIHDSMLRERALGHVVLIWARTEKERARKFIGAVTSLTPTQKTELIRKIDAH